MRQTARRIRKSILLSRPQKHDITMKQSNLLIAKSPPVEGLGVTYTCDRDFTQSARVVFFVVLAVIISEIRAGLFNQQTK